MFNEFDLSKDWKTTRLNGDVLDYLGKLVTDGKLDPVCTVFLVMFSCVMRVMTQVGERIYPLDQVELAFKSLAAGGHKGKLVVRMAPEPEPEPGALVFRG